MFLSHRPARLLIALAIAVACVVCASAQPVSYDIVYVKQPRYGGEPREYRDSRSASSRRNIRFFGANSGVLPRQQHDQMPLGRFDARQKRRGDDHGDRQAHNKAGADELSPCIRRWSQH